jgi:hypothetical protein
VTKTPSESSTEVELKLPAGNELRDMSFDEIAALFEGQTVDALDVIETDAIGEILNGDDKSRLLGQPFFILDFRFNIGDQGDFVSMRVVTKNGDKYVVNDGSTGLYAQLKTVAEKGVTRGIACRHGLRKSDYLYCPECRETLKKGENNCVFHPDVTPKKASTFYIDVK